MAGSAFKRSGRPEHINGATAAATVEKWSIRNGPTQRLVFHNTHATESIVLTLTTEAEAGDGIGLLIRAGYGVDLDVEVLDFWTQSTNASSFQALAVCRI